MKYDTSYSGGPCIFKLASCGGCLVLAFDLAGRQNNFFVLTVNAPEIAAGPCSSMRRANFYPAMPDKLVIPTLRHVLTQWTILLGSIYRQVALTTTAASILEPHHVRNVS